MKERRTLVRTMAVVTSAAALAWLAVTGAGTDGDSAAGAAAAGAMQPVADEGPGFAIEDFGYPNADKILAERNIVLKRGDGHIVLAECGDPALMEVWSREKERVCFKVTGTKGYLALEIPAVYAVKGNSYSAQVDMTVGTEEQSFDVKKNVWTPVGESADSQGRDFILMEIRTNK
ncbi:hypothetical protein K7B10_23350 [Streptomyces flavotricini]|uniref:Secreted protein n=1 Tax=Streptomyces flavotricini TaxID=66888 RepID=A0ABS8E9S6_9ACTN|nr:hypothetical protein [Streptomyces flavotricini]MCC0097663.1 hypothetical protein [Streptomyces flavotricini]